ncbi:sensor histidine kinase [Nocardioides marmorisolisilvae]|uniref:Sensor-like histidine kinase SenX3 n=1 Tax=Nocardioides marmorisolisilvae TaxID=1542737 RepID=A0A3N0DZU1_9ACTN|nr:ATP-binding protein [Nocardioides marmorisolisilvae]RNL81091.1 ATP-binding protein [Nocardioides marmorisolisilvae]
MPQGAGRGLPARPRAGTDLAQDRRHRSTGHGDGRPVAFGRVLANILVNAVRYSPAGSPIDVELSEDHRLGRVTVADRGRGIEEADLATIFDEFARGSSVKGDGGSGLGLFSVHQLVTEQHGTVGISSTPGEGTTVTIELPRVA